MIATGALNVTAGSGMVATEPDLCEINAGIVVQINAGGRRWHGAKVDTTMDHIRITLVGSKVTWA